MVNLGNLGVGGQTTSQILARIGAVLALNPGWVVLTAGTNNMGVAGGVAQAKADITAMLDIYDAAGIRVVISTLPPRLSGNYTGTIRADTLALNEWIRGQARTRPGLIVLDYFAVLADGNTGNYVATIYGFNPTTDGIHLSATGAYACGKMLAAALRPFVTPVVPYSLTTNGANLLTSSLARPAGSGAAAPTGWSFSGTASGGSVWSDVARTDDFLGQWKQLVIPTGGSMTLSGTTNAAVDGTRLAVGDVVNGILEFDVSAVETGLAVEGQGICFGVKAWNGTTFTNSLYAFNYFRGPNEARSGVLRTPDFTVPAGTTLVALYLELRGGQTFKFDRVGIYNRKTYPV
jgi:lysophospholipase L1-like esterase